MPVLRAEHLAFAFGGRDPVLEDVNLTLRAGELAVVVGRNGSGKTTLLRLLSGLLVPTAGRVWIEDGAEIVRGQVGILFQNPDHQMIAPTVEEELALGLELRGAEAGCMRAVVEDLLQRFELTKLRDVPPESLSGGQKQRVALAAIMASAPPFLLLDEPDSYLDAPSRRDLAAAIETSRERCGMLWMMPHAARLPVADYYYLLSKGRLLPCGHDELRTLTAA